MRAERYTDLARQYALFCKNHGGNVLHRIAAGASEDDYAWTEALMQAVDELSHGTFPALPFEAISVHYYTIGGTWTAKGSATQFDGDIFASCRDGTLAVARETSPGKFAIVQTVATKPGAKTMGLDPTTHTLYLPTAESAGGSSGKSQPATQPGSFMILVVRAAGK